QPKRRTRRAAATAVVAVALGTGAGIALAASAGTRDGGFATVGSGLNGAVNALAVQSDGRIVVGGAFTAYDGTGRSRIARLTTTGALDTSFDPGSGLDGPVEAVALRASGGILVAGTFSKADGQNRSGLAEFGPTGSLDTGFDTGTGTAGAAARAVLALPSGGAMLGGAFTTYGGVSQKGIAEVRANGALETGWFGYVDGPSPVVNAIVRRSDEALIAGGAFTLAQTTARGRIALFGTSGTVDAAWANGSGFDGTVEALALQGDGKVVVGGQFTAYDGTSRPRIARLNADGSLDTSFAPGAGFDAPVAAVAMQADGGISVGGSFTAFAGAATPFVTRLLGTATADPSPAAPAPPAVAPPAPPASPAAPQPVVGRDGVARAVRGSVTVRLPGTDEFVSLDRGVPQELPVGSQVDTRRGAVSIRIREGGAAGPTRNVVVSRGVFTFQQNVRRGKPTLTDIRLSQPLACGASRKEAAKKRRARVPRTRSRTVRVSVAKTKQRRKRGVVRTRSRYITGTARGTSWSASDTCRYSRVKVFRGVVGVRNLVTRRTVTVRAKRTYIVRKR
ncbi:MAG: delta-60 repeat domain-containing protein, partial [Miltoncostaeaceae bacterium]